MMLVTVVPIKEFDSCRWELHDGKDTYSYIVNKSSNFTTFYKHWSPRDEHDLLRCIIPFDENDIDGSVERFEKMRKIYKIDKDRFDKDPGALQKYLVLI